jgi:hypothetical protein
MMVDLVRADRRGLSVSPDEFSRLIRQVNQEVFDNYISNFEKSTENSDSMGYWKVFNETVALVVSGDSAVGTLPADYYYIIGRPRVVVGGVTKRVDLVTTYEDAMREDDYLTKATTDHPTCQIGGVDGNDDVRIRVKPSTLTAIYIDYLKTITVPYLDYYTDDTTYEVTFLPESAVAQNIPTGCTYRDGTTGGAAVFVTSLTVDLLWDDSDLALILAKLLKKVGIQLPDEILVQSGITDEVKNEA